MTRDITLLLIGAAIALGSSIITALAQHFLSLREEKIKRAWEKKEKESNEFKKSLTEGTQVQLSASKRELLRQFEREHDIRLDRELNLMREIPGTEPLDEDERKFTEDEIKAMMKRIMKEREIIEAVLREENEIKEQP